MTFWLLSIAILLGAGLLVLWPLLGGNSRWKTTGLAVLLAIPLLAYWQYQWVGTPQAMQAQQAPPGLDTGNSNASLDQLVITLQERLSESAADLEGWVLLGRSYKTLQNYPAAVDALETANRLVPNEPIVLVELVEARMFASGDPNLTPGMVDLLEQAVAGQPELQKGWWLLGIAAAQQGDDEQAISYWRKLLQGIEPGSGVAQSVQAQIAEAETRLGKDSPGSSAENPGLMGSEAQQAGDWQSPAIRVEWPAKATAEVPASSVLFLIARAPGTSSGPPLAVKRINQPAFPLELVLTDSDSMMPQRPVSGTGTLEVQARLSVSGEPLAQPGDWQSLPLLIEPGQSGGLQLTLDQLVE